MASSQPTPSIVKCFAIIPFPRLPLFLSDFVFLKQRAISVSQKNVMILFEVSFLREGNSSKKMCVRAT